MALIFILLTQLINLTTSTLTFQAGGGGSRRSLLPELPPAGRRCARPSRVLRRLRETDPGGWKIRVLLDGRFTGIELDPHVVLDYVRLVFRVDGDGDGDVLCVDGVRENRCSDFLFRHRYFGWMRNYYWNRRLVESIDRSDSKLATKLRDLEGQCQHLERCASPPKESPKENKQDHKFNEDEIKSPPRSWSKFDHRPPGPSLVQTSTNDIFATTAKWPMGPREIPPRHLAPDQVKSGGKISINDNENTRAREPIENGGKGPTERFQPYHAPPPQRPRPAYDESSSNGVEKDSFVHGMLLMFALIAFIWLEFLF